MHERSAFKWSRNVRTVLTVFTLCFSGLAAAQQKPTKRQADGDAVRRLVSLVDYIGGDYAGAVSGGKVISEAEYQEMQEFAVASMAQFRRVEKKLPADKVASIAANLQGLAALIAAKADAATVAQSARSIKDGVISAFAIVTAPSQTPSRQIAKLTYDKNCVSCHGQEGRANGPIASKLDPPPRDFFDKDVMGSGSPFKFYNTMFLGVEGTGMAPFGQALSNHEIWSVAFQVAGLRHADLLPKDQTPAQLWALLPDAVKVALKPVLSLEWLARSSDDDLNTWLRNEVPSLKEPNSADQVARTLAILRVAAPYLGNVPRHLTQVQQPIDGDRGGSEQSGDRQAANENDAAGSANAKAGIVLARSKVQAARVAMESGDREQVEALLLDGYLQGFERAEKALALKRRVIVSGVEESFIRARALGQEGDSPQFGAALSSLDALLVEAQVLLDTPTEATQGTSNSGDFAASFIIIVREGFEAFLIIAALLAILKGMGASAAARWVHAGWIAAIVAGIGTWFLMASVIEVSGAARETIEAVCSLAAAAVLFYVSFWLLSQAERTKWERFIRSSAAKAMTSGKLWTVFGLSFVAVYREAAETALFYQALVASAASTSSVWWGLGVGAAAISLISFGVVYLGLRLPLRQFFLGTSYAMIAISVVLVGKGVNEFVEAGFIQPTNLAHMPRVEILGLYPSVETLASQALLLLLAGAVWAMTLGRRAGEAVNK